MAKCEVGCGENLWSDTRAVREGLEPPADDRRRAVLSCDHRSSGIDYSARIAMVGSTRNALHAGK
jgi:hypothetical protein